MSPHGTYTTVDGRPAVRFERRLEHPVAVVWRAVSEPAGLAHWFPGDVTLDPRPGGAMRFAMGDDDTLAGEVIELDPPKRFSFLWDTDLLQLDLAPDGDGTRLTLLHVLRSEGADAAAKTAAGWHVCLDLLHGHLAGEPGAGPDGPTPEWQRRYDEYVARGVPAGAPIPGAA